MPEGTLNPGPTPADEAALEATRSDVEEGQSSADEHLLDDLLVEEVSIDGMCGVY